MKQKEIAMYMDWALRTAQLSTANRLKVGSVMVNGNNIAYGYNGTPKGWNNACEKIDETGESKTLDYVIHAEENVLLKCAAEGMPCRGGTLFISHAPCLRCSSRLIQAEIKTVYYKYNYRDPSGIRALLDSGIDVIQLTDLGDSKDELLYCGYEIRQMRLF
jgi:dCMP deaminase